MAKKSVLGPLSIGNVVSAGLRIYRDHFKSYFTLAAQAYLWVLVPIFGWAKYSAISALISRLAYQEVLERPESISEARPIVSKRMWRFFSQGILLSLIFIGALLGLIFAWGIIIGVLSSVLGGNNPIVYLVGVLLFFVALFVYFWLWSKLFIAPLPLAIEDDMTAMGAIRRSWELTKGSVLRIQGVLFVGILITLPISIVLQIFIAIVQAILAALLPPDSTSFATVSILISLGISVLSGIFLLPFWQAISGVIYYDLRARREGLGLDLNPTKDRKPRL